MSSIYCFSCEKTDKNKIERNTYKQILVYITMFFCEKCHHLLNIKKDSSEGVFFCEGCGFSKPIDNTTLIYQSIRENVSNEEHNFDPELCTLDIYQRKILKECSNKKCPTKGKTEVVIAKDGNFNVSYVCTTCKSTC